MTSLVFGIVAGTVFGVLAILPMLRMTFPDKRAAIAAAFIERFGIGLVIGVVSLAWPGWLIGLVFGLLLSLPSALITKAHVPILVMGTIGGLLIGLARTTLLR